MRILVCGGRDYKDYATLFSVLDSKYLCTLIIHGDARGADHLADEWARSRGISLAVFPANWKGHGKSAGPIRNRLMLDYMKPDLVVAFPGGRGTADMVKYARAMGVPVEEIHG